MVSIRLGTLRPWMVVGILVFAGGVLSGCATTPEPAPGPTADEVNQRLAALEECITTSEEVVEAAMVAGVGGGDMAPVSRRITDAQEALAEARQLLQEGKNREAMDRVSQALGECEKLVPMAQKARKESLKRAAAAKRRMQAEAGMARVTPCVEAAQRAIQSAESAGATAAELAPARAALANAEAALAEAKDLMAQGKAKKAVLRLDAAETDCLSARDLGNQIGIRVAARASAKPGSYTVVGGDTLWGISGSGPIYENPFMWPLIYKANRDQIRDPDLIFPNQTFAIPRAYGQEEADAAVRRARTRGPWRLGDGPDYYILEGVRR